MRTDVPEMVSVVPIQALESMSGLPIFFAVGGNGHGCLMAIRSGWLFPRMVFHIVRGTAKCAASAYMPDCRFRQLQCRA